MNGPIEDLIQRPNQGSDQGAKQVQPRALAKGLMKDPIRDPIKGPITCPPRFAWIHGREFAMLLSDPALNGAFVYLDEV